jgi:hypothetical protein
MKPHRRHGPTSPALRLRILLGHIRNCHILPYLEKARRISDRQRARLLIVQVHNYLKCAEETEAKQLSAR